MKRCQFPSDLGTGRVDLAFCSHLAQHIVCISGESWICNETVAERGYYYPAIPFTLGVSPAGKTYRQNSVRCEVLWISSFLTKHLKGNARKRQT